MRKQIILTDECVRNIAQSFSDPEEAQFFISDLDDATDELSFLYQLRIRSTSEEQTALFVIKQACTLAMFCREHIELVQQLISCLDYRDLTEEELKELEGE